MKSKTQFRVLLKLFSALLILFVGIQSKANFVNAETTEEGEYSETINNITWTIEGYSDNTAAITSCGDTILSGAITIPESVCGYTVTRISNWSILADVTSLTLPDSFETMQQECFNGLDELTDIIVSDTNPDYQSRNGILYDSTGTDLLVCPCGKSGSIEIPDGVTAINEYAFYNCDRLTQILLPETLSSIGEFAFYYCHSLTSLTIPEGITEITDYTLARCNSLTSITIPASVTTIGTDNFDSCQSLTSINVAAGNEIYSSVNGVLLNQDGTTLIKYPGGLSDTSSIPASVTIISAYACYECPALTSVSLSNQVTSISEYAFADNPNLENVILPDSVTTLGNSAFWYCTSLQSITFPEDLDAIGNYTCCWCTSLTTIVFPESLTSIGNSAFFFCSSLTTLTIPDSVTSVGKYAFSQCSSLSNVTLSKYITLIDTYAFNNCNALSTVYFKGTAEDFTTFKSGVKTGNTKLTRATIQYI